MDISAQRVKTLVDGFRECNSIVTFNKTEPLVLNFH